MKSYTLTYISNASSQARTACLKTCYQASSTWYGLVGVPCDPSLATYNIGQLRYHFLEPNTYFLSFMHMVAAPCHDISSFKGTTTKRPSTKRPSLQNVLPAKRPSTKCHCTKRPSTKRPPIQNVLLYKTSSSTKRPSTKRPQIKNVLHSKTSSLKKNIYMKILNQ